MSGFVKFLTSFTDSNQPRKHFLVESVGFSGHVLAAAEYLDPVQATRACIRTFKSSRAIVREVRVVNPDGTVKYGLSVASRFK